MAKNAAINDNSPIDSGHIHNKVKKQRRTYPNDYPSEIKVFAT